MTRSFPRVSWAWALGLTMALTFAVSSAMAQNTPPKTVAGKVVKVTHHKVKVDTQWLDQVDVTVDSCAAPGQLVTVSYSPASISDRAALGHLFEEDLQSARTPDMKAQQLPNGYGLFWVDAANRVQRTGLLGSKLDCAAVPALIQQFP